MSKLYICTKCGDIVMRNECIREKCNKCNIEIVELTALTLLQAKANIYGYTIFDEGDECLNCHGHEVQRIIPSEEGGISRICKKCNAAWGIIKEN